MTIGFSPSWDPVRRVAVTVEDSPNVESFGLGYFHVRQAKAHIALGVVELGRSLVYRGNLNHDGFLDFINQLRGRYTDHPYHAGPFSITSYLAWSDHIAMDSDELTSMFKAHEGLVDLVMLTKDGNVLKWNERLQLKPQVPSVEERRASATAAHRVIREHSDARIIAGGAFDGEEGHPPDIAEQALLSLKAKQPLYLVGRLGGCTRAIAEALGVVERWTGSHRIWPGSKAFDAFGIHSLHNELSMKENQIVANTGHFSRALSVIVEGFDRIRELRQRKVA